MINHHETLKILSVELKGMLEGMRFSSAFTFRKNELLLEFKGKEPKTLFFNAVKGKSYLCVMAGSLRPKKKQTVRLFNELNGLKLISNLIEENENMISIQFEGGLNLRFVFFGSLPNVLILNTESKILNSFKSPAKLKNLSFSEAFQSGNIQMVTGVDKLKESFKAKPSVKIKKALRNTLPLVNKTVADELIFRAGLLPDTLSHTLSNRDFKELLNAYKSIRSAFSVPKLLLYDSSPPVFSLIELTHLQGISSDSFKSVNNAIIETNKALNAYENLIKKKREALKGLKSKLKSVSERTQKQKVDLAKLKDRKDWDKIADILISNLTLFKKGMKTVSLTDFDGNEIEIKLDPLLPPAANAQRYYKKAKSARSGEKKLDKVIAEGEREIPVIKNLITEIDKVASMSEWNEIEKSLKKKKTPIKKKEDFISYPYRKFDLANGYMVMVGKSAKDNDKLTFKVAKKNDLWLHVQGAQGSHVIVPAIKKGNPFPRDIIIQAAQIAARYSSQKHSGMVPVIYTLRKYVWKKKGLAPGAVHIKNEKSIMVKPG